MPQAVITYVGEPLPATVHMVGDHFPFTPRFKARVAGQAFLQATVRLGFIGAANLNSDLARVGVPEESRAGEIARALLLYGIRRVEALVLDLLGANREPEQPSQVWDLNSEDDVSQLVGLALRTKECSYQHRLGRDLYCTAASLADKSVVFAIDGRRAAPTSRPLCARCQLPRAELLCSHLLHPQVAALIASMGVAERRLSRAMCDQGRPEVDNVSRCQAGGNECWQRIVEAEPAVGAMLSPLGLPESFDVLDNMWRLAFGKDKRLLSLGTTTVPGALVLGCASRIEFESRVSALADLIDLLKVDDELLPDGLTKEEKTGSIKRLEKSLLFKLPTAQHDQAKEAITTLRRVRQTRNAMQHSGADGGFTKSLHSLGIRDAPPNWAGAWDSVRVQTANALTIIRGELRRWIDAANS